MSALGSNLGLLQTRNVIICQPPSAEYLKLGRVCEVTDPSVIIKIVIARFDCQFKSCFVRVLLSISVIRQICHKYSLTSPPCDPFSRQRNLSCSMSSSNQPRRAIRIANCSGAKTDPGHQMLRQATKGQVDVITGGMLGLFY